MRISRYNHEGYFDPTPFDAYKGIGDRTAAETGVVGNSHGFRPIVYICSPFAGDTEANLFRARRYCRFAVQKGFIPIAAHLFFPQFLDDDDPDQRALGLFMARVLLTKCQEVWVFGEEITSGMAMEITKARRRQMPIRYFTTECEEVRA